MPYRLRKVGDSPGPRHKLTRDERAAMNIRLPFAVQLIISSSMEEFGDMLNSWPLTEQQLSLCRDIRRRGKNKIAAQNCRRRKLEQITELEEEVASVRGRRERLVEERAALEEGRRRATARYGPSPLSFSFSLLFLFSFSFPRLATLESFLLEQLAGEAGPSGWSLSVTRDQRVEVVGPPSGPLLSVA
jgi:hypothetical protein